MTVTDIMTNAVNHPFGGCPECGLTDGYLNWHRSHIFICDKHRLAWPVPEFNIFRTWEDEDEDIWEENRRVIEDKSFEQVKPVYGGVTTRPKPAIRPDVAPHGYKHLHRDFERLEDWTDEGTKLNMTPWLINVVGTKEEFLDSLIRTGIERGRLLTLEIANPALRQYGFETATAEDLKAAIARCEQTRTEGERP